MTKYRDHKEVYTRDYSRWSVYPKIPRPEEFQRKKITPGTIVSIEIRDIDEKGRGVAFYNNMKIKVNGGGTVGDRVKAKIVHVKGDEAIADIIEWL